MSELWDNSNENCFRERISSNRDSLVYKSTAKSSGPRVISGGLAAILSK